MKVAIIGAGIAGLIAQSAFLKIPDAEVFIFDKKTETSNPFSNHRAMMRLRNKDILNYLDCQLTKITCRKELHNGSTLKSVSSISDNNRYSYELYGTISERSLGDLGIVDRYTISNIRPKQQINIANVKFIYDNTIHFKDIPDSYHYDICISTIPMPHILKILDEDCDVEFKYSPIYISEIELGIESNVHQTIYFINNNSSAYRATIEGSRFFVESSTEIKDMHVFEALATFGVPVSGMTELKNIKRHCQKFGKIALIDDIKRRNIMIELTAKHNIYSFGRYATWRPLRVDQILDDIEKIKTMALVNTNRWYNMEV